MFLDFYQLKEQPFGVTPDPRFLYLGASHREALASLSYGVKMGRGLTEFNPGLTDGNSVAVGQRLALPDLIAVVDNVSLLASVPRP